MQSIIVEGLRFGLFLSQEAIVKRVAELAREIGEKYRDNNPVFVCVLNGSFFFTADLLQHTAYDYEVCFVRVKSYDGLHSSHEIREYIGFDHNIEGRHIVILEDIVESGLTMNYLLAVLKEHHAASVSIATLLFKPEKLLYPHLPIDFIGFSIPNAFVIGYGLDLHNKARNLRSIYQLLEDNPTSAEADG